MPKIILSQSPYHRTEYIRDEHDESGTIYSKKTFYDDEIAERNKKNRNKGTIKTGDKLPLLGGCRVVYLFKANPIQWADFKRRHPEIIGNLYSRDMLAREKAAADIESMHPEWILAAPSAKS